MVYMIKQKINRFIDNIPAIPKNVRECASFLEQGDLNKASAKASSDIAFVRYLINLF